jgi:hypothetical protein
MLHDVQIRGAHAATVRAYQYLTFSGYGIGQFTHVDFLIEQVCCLHFFAPRHLALGL